MQHPPDTTNPPVLCRNKSDSYDSASCALNGELYLCSGNYYDETEGDTDDEGFHCATSHSFERINAQTGACTRLRNVYRPIEYGSLSGVRREQRLYLVNTAEKDVRVQSYDIESDQWELEESMPPDCAMGTVVMYHQPC
eukprot:TRINITY_DN1400_c0_g1_i1.p2 TRINITY_DN1400_c0_g1~~TRINITY_DN1400_c0_g1_i1.p2  ORF type:complete len:139 (-),score=28.14 TRINITY_DN1400_c0_g1_i1:75-491(-)